MVAAESMLPLDTNDLHDPAGVRRTDDDILAQLRDWAEAIARARALHCGPMPLDDQRYGREFAYTD